MNFAHILHNFCTQIRRINHSLVFVWIHSIYSITVESEWSSRFCPWFYNKSYQIFYFNATSGNTFVKHTFVVSFFPFVSVVIFQIISFFHRDFVWVEHIPSSVYIVTNHLPEQIRVANRWEHIVCLHSVITIVCSKLQKFQYILVPYIQVYSYRTLAHSQLIHCNSSIICKFNPSDNSTCNTLETTNVGSICTNFSEIQSHSTTMLRNLCEIIYRTINSFQSIRNSVYETAWQLIEWFSGVTHRRSCHSHFQCGQIIVNLLCPMNSILFFKCQMHRNSHEHFLCRFHHSVVMSFNQISFYNQIQSTECE